MNTTEKVHWAIMLIGLMTTCGGFLLLGASERKLSIAAGQRLFAGVIGVVLALGASYHLVESSRGLPTSEARSPLQVNEVYQTVTAHPLEGGGFATIVAERDGTLRFYLTRNNLPYLFKVGQGERAGETVAHTLNSGVTRCSTLPKKPS